MVPAGTPKFVAFSKNKFFKMLLFRGSLLIINFYGEIDYLVDDYDNLSMLPIEVKSGKNYHIHNATNNLINIQNYNINIGIVFNNNREVKQKKNYYICQFTTQCLSNQFKTIFVRKKICILLQQTQQVS